MEILKDGVGLRQENEILDILRSGNFSLEKLEEPIGHEGWTLLMLAVHFELRRVVEYLLFKRGVDTSYHSDRFRDKDYHSKSALYIASRNRVCFGDKIIHALTPGFWRVTKLKMYICIVFPLPKTKYSVDKGVCVSLTKTHRDVIFTTLHCFERLDIIPTELVLKILEKSLCILY